MQGLYHARKVDSGYKYGGKTLKDFQQEKNCFLHISKAHSAVLKRIWRGKRRRSKASVRGVCMRVRERIS
jgi:hypothetical protein